MTYLGIDYGAAHIGVAISSGSLAQPLTTFPTKNAVSQISDLIKKHGIEGIIVGDCLPEFLTALKSFGLTVHQVDETLTTRDAQQALFHTSQSRRKAKEHSVAAALILQFWLDSKPQNV